MFHFSCINFFRHINFGIPFNKTTLYVLCLNSVEQERTAGLHNSESSKGQIDQHKLAACRKSLFRGSVEEILKGQVIIRSRAFATFSATEFSRAARKDLAGRMLCRPGVQLKERPP